MASLLNAFRSMKDYRAFIITFAWVTAGIMLLSFGIALWVKPDIMGIINWTDTKGFSSNKTQTEKFLQYVMNNGVKVPFQMLLLSLIPIPFVYYAPVALTAAVTGVIFYLPFAPQLQDKMSFLKVFLGVFPHSTIEFFSFTVISAALYFFNNAIRAYVFKKVHSDIRVLYAAKRAAAAYGLVAFPLLVIAAFVEAFLTPLIT